MLLGLLVNAFLADCARGDMITPALAQADNAQNSFSVDASSTKIAQGNYQYTYNVTNAASSPENIDSVTMDHSVNATVIENSWGSKNGWTFTNAPGVFGWHYDPGFFQGPVVSRISSGSTGTFKAYAQNTPVTGNVTAFFTGFQDASPNQIAIGDKTVPDDIVENKVGWKNTPGGSGTFDAATGEWGYGFQLTAISNVSDAILLFDPSVDLANIHISMPGWALLHVGFGPDDPSLAGDRSDPDLKGIAILYATSAGSSLLPGESIDLTLASSFRPGNVFGVNGDIVSGPSSVPEPPPFSLLGTGLLLAGAFRKLVSRAARRTI